ncbi:SCO2523 family variant P-loop protein [Solwaraspora sp. WMMD792]|uniref:SCO2523 family variant P-loop protein n=1 Tax=Solwaraspora sp. WMMD792 TaxID=3016099 RepID=UPI0024168897|nr:SCO2523 family variant P-loop protein [Solwaraspora sp. WMMD792]MDG4772707.1 SCO2523 family variant P-loop protein [Solwaraspora sp. WMMD792]
MFVFAMSDKGGTGRSVTSINVLYRAAMRGDDVCYLDFDFGSPTAGAIFGVSGVERGTDGGNGLHRYLHGKAVGELKRIDIWREARGLGGRPAGAGQLTLFPGDEGGGEFARPPSGEMIDRCADLFQRLSEEFSVCLIDLSAGRSIATELALAATNRPQTTRIHSQWLVFHRWTRQHVIAAAGLAFGVNGLLEQAEARGHDPAGFNRRIRFVRTATIDPAVPARLTGLSATQVAWLQKRNQELDTLASTNGVGRSVRLGTVPLDPMLQWQEQLISDEDVARGVANGATLEAFENLAERITDKSTWEQS